MPRQKGKSNSEGNLLSKYCLRAVLAFIAICIPCADVAYAATNDKLDVNLSMIYLGVRSQKDSNSLSEAVIQFPLPLTPHARSTGQGLFGGLTYFDTKTLVSDNTQLVSEMGLGRIYYSYSVPGEKPYTFVPFVTFYRQFSFSFKNSTSANSELTNRTFFLPGVFYAYRLDEHFAIHLDTELYSYSELSDYRARVGFSYNPSWPWIFSVSHDRLGWDIDGQDSFVSVQSRDTNIKIIFRDPPQGNFALTIGYGNAVRNAMGSALQQPGTIFGKGTYFGVEASAGVLAW